MRREPPRESPRESNDETRVLFLKLGALGDLSFALPAPRAIKKAMPGGRVSWVVGQGLADLLRGHPQIDELIVVDEKKFFSGNPVDRAAALSSLSWRLRGRFDLAMVAHRAKSYAFFLRPFVSGRIFRLGRSESDRAMGAETVVTPPFSQHESLAVRKLVETAVGKKVEWSWDYSYIEDGSSRYEKPLVVHLGGGSNFKTEFKLKQWPHWRELVENLIRSGVHVICVGAPSESESAAELERSLGSELVVNRVGKTSLRELVSLIRSARGFVGIDSGPLHLADSLGIPSVGLYGPTSPISWGLLGERSKPLSTSPGCSPCYQDDGNFPECGFSHRCMKDLKPFHVLLALRELSVC